jgi:hypothetical protein
MRRGAPCTVVSPCRCLVTPVVRPSRQCPSVRSAELSWLRIDQVASDRWSLRTAPSGRASLLAGSARAPAMPSLAGPRPPLGVHPSDSHGRGPVVQPSGVQPSDVQLSGVQSAGSVVRGPTVRPAGVRPPGPLLVGGSPAVAVGSPRRRATLRPGRIELQVVCRSRAAWSRARVGLEGAMLWWSAGGGAAVADLAGSGSGAGCDRARPLAGGEASLA